MQSQNNSLAATLQDLLQNTLVLRHISPYLGLANVIRLAATSKSFRDVIYDSPGVFQHADLTKLSPRIFRPGDTTPEATESESTDQFYSRPVRRVLRSLQRHNVLHDIRTLILDGLAVPLTLLTNILCNDAYDVRILSLRGVKELGDEKLLQLLRYIIRAGRPDGTPRLKGLYYFTPIEARADYSVRRGLELFSLPPDTCIESIALRSYFALPSDAVVSYVVAMCRSVGSSLISQWYTTSSLMTQE